MKSARAFAAARQFTAAGRNRRRGNGVGGDRYRRDCKTRRGRLRRRQCVEGGFSACPARMEIGATAKPLKIEERQRALTKFDQTAAAKIGNHAADVNLGQPGGVGDVMLTQREIHGAWRPASNHGPSAAGPGSKSGGRYAPRPTAAPDPRSTGRRGLLRQPVIQDTVQKVGPLEQKVLSTHGA